MTYGTAVAKPKVLVVDDLRANRVAMHHLLARLDIEIIDAANGNEALAATLDHEFALILLDVQMPEMDGFEVAQFLRDEEHTRSVPIIFVTAALTDELNRLKGYDAGAVDYIIKPINEAILLSKVRSFVELFESRNKLQLALAALDERNAQLEVEVNDRRRAEAEARHLATHDTLTGLPNRLLFNDRLNSAIARAHRERARLALGYMDLDGFKLVNDQYGHAAGDALLREFARRLHASIRDSDTAARLGGDEFAVIFHAVSGIESTLALAQKLWGRLTGPAVVPDGDNSVEVPVAVSLGLALYPDHGTGEDNLMHAADLALYQIKKNGKADYAVYSPAAD